MAALGGGADPRRRHYPGPAAPDALVVVRVAEAARLLGVSRTAMYELVASGQVP